MEIGLRFLDCLFFEGWPTTILFKLGLSLMAWCSDDIMSIDLRSPSYTNDTENININNEEGIIFNKKMGVLADEAEVVLRLLRPSGRDKYMNDWSDKFVGGGVSKTIKFVEEILRSANEDWEDVVTVERVEMSRNYHRARIVKDMCKDELRRRARESSSSKSNNSSFECTVKSRRQNLKSELLNSSNDKLLIESDTHTNPGEESTNEETFSPSKSQEDISNKRESSEID